MAHVKVKTKYTLVGADYSQQEPRLLTAMTQDPKLLDAYNNNKDMYATLGTGVYNNDYWDNMEHFQDGTKNEEGALRRKKMKTLYLAITYGMGAPALAERLDCTKEEAQKFIDDFYKGFPVVKDWMDKTIEDAHRTGYVTDNWGRKRRLTDISLPEFSIVSEQAGRFNPILGAKPINAEVDQATKDEIITKLKSCRSAKDRSALQQQLENNLKLKITNNGGFISRAERQCINARIQGSAATMTKKAMIAIHNDEEMQKLGFRLLIAVHDELIGECPVENAEAAAERLSFLMKNAAKDVPVPFKCDAEIVYRWYADQYQLSLRNEYKALIEGNAKKGIKPHDEETAFNILCKDHVEMLPEQIKHYLEDDDIMSAF